MQVVNDPSEKKGTICGIPTWAAVMTGFFALVIIFQFILIFIVFSDNARIEQRIDIEKQETMEIIKLMRAEVP